MDPRTLHAAMGGVMSPDYYASVTAQANAVMLRGGMTTTRRVQFFLAQVREESVGLKYTQEIGSDQYLNGQPYHPYVGRTFIQITWQGNYAKFGQWMHGLGLIGDPDAFVHNPGMLADPRWAWWGALWYWQEHNLNRYADANDFRGLTVAINGGLNGWDSRQQCLAEIERLGDAVRPTPAAGHAPASASSAAETPVAPPPPPQSGDPDIMDPATRAYLDKQFADIDHTASVIVHGDSAHPHSLDRLFAWLDDQFAQLRAEIAALKAGK